MSRLYEYNRHGYCEATLGRRLRGVGRTQAETDSSSLHDGSPGVLEVEICPHCSKGCS